MSAPSYHHRSPSPFDGIPRSIATSSIMPYVTSHDWLNFRVVSRGCYEIVHDTTDVYSNAAGGSESEALWRLALVKDYQFDGSEDESILHQCIRCSMNEDGAFLSTDNIFTAENSFISWKHWRKIDLRIHSQRNNDLAQGERVNGPYFLRSASMWRKIEQWCDSDRSGSLGRYIKRSLLPGRAFDPNPRGHVTNAKTAAFKAVYSFYSGQGQPYNTYDGLFGGFQAYDIISNTRWVEPDVDDTDNCIYIAEGEGKVLAISLGTGHMFLHCQRNERQFYATPCNHPVDSKDSILRWFEEHAFRLSNDFILISKINHGIHSYPYLSRCPAVADTTNCSRAVTRGVEIVASSISAPEFGIHVYSIRIRLLTPADGDEYMTPKQRGFETCQLLSRYWKISKSPDNFDEVRGEGVIGMYPLLYEGGHRNFEGGGIGELEQGEDINGTFAYQSCTQADIGVMEGYLQFRPGSVNEPSGEIFNARVAPFPLKLGSFLY